MKKINIHAVNLDREGYDNLNPGHDYSCYTYDSESIDEIIINVGGLESIERQNIQHHFSHWYRILKFGGTIKIYFNDIYHMANNLIYNRISVIDFETEIIRKHKSLHDMNNVNEYLKAYNFNIETCNYYDGIGIVHATKK